MNGYKAFWRGKTCEVFADTAIKAQLLAAAKFKARREYEVSVVLCEKEGEPVSHSTGEF
jgi:hypothetical protein